ncbi:hypothetical protein DRN67_00750 [Candidatus Micrarchaeota archaeon]|nr:MAG: hypothetical protein DRN67_00750 [Candidatus Micrarchaeota archaeon]
MGKEGLTRRVGQKQMEMERGEGTDGEGRPVRSLRTMRGLRESRMKTPNQELLERVYTEGIHNRDEGVHEALEELEAEVGLDVRERIDCMPLDGKLRQISRVGKLEVSVDLESDGFAGAFKKLKDAVEAYDARQSSEESEELVAR